MKTAITPTRAEDYPQWYQKVIAAAQLADHAPVRGCMVMRPWGYALWEHIQSELDQMLKATGHVNAYFPLLIPISYLEKEAEHVEGFAKECAVVTHTRLVQGKDDRLVPDGALEEPLVVRPTSETVIGAMYAKWVQSYRDLPLKINQWANVMRWEMRTRLFLRTSEFLWQEGHTAHADKKEAMDEALAILSLYETLAKDVLAMPVLTGEKTISERFPGAVNTYCIEALMQDGKALQAGTSHFLGQNFSKASGIQFSTKEGGIAHAWTTSWGVSTRLIGGVIMVHGDDDGVCLPPAIAPYHLVIIPVFKESQKEAVFKYAQDLAQACAQQTFRGKPVRVYFDDRDFGGGDKKWEWIKKGVPIRIEVGPRDIEKHGVMLALRHQSSKSSEFVARDDLAKRIEGDLNTVHDALYARALEAQKNNMREVDSLVDLVDHFSSGKTGFVQCYAHDSDEMHQHLKPLKVTPRCVLMDDVSEGSCVFTGKAHARKTVFAKAY